MAATVIEKATLDFVKNIENNNNREWFAQHKNQYTAANTNIIAFADSVLAEMNKHDKIETMSGKDSVFRIYRDVRFSKDKSPYHNYWSGSFKRATKYLRGGYYFHIQPGGSFAGGGFWGPEPKDMKRIRQDIDMNYEDWNRMLANKTLVSTFGKMAGEQLSGAPRGYDKSHPAIELLRYKQFIFRRPFTDEEVLAKNFARQLSDTFKNMRTFLDFMSEVLTTDANGIPLEE